MDIKAPAAVGTAEIPSTSIIPSGLANATQTVSGDSTNTNATQAAQPRSTIATSKSANPTTTVAARPNKADTRIIALSSAIGSLTLLVVLALALFFFRRRSRARRGKKASGNYWAKAELDDTQRRKSRETIKEMDANAEIAELDGRERIGELAVDLSDVQREGL